MALLVEKILITFNVKLLRLAKEVDVFVYIILLFCIKKTCLIFIMYLWKLISNLILTSNQLKQVCYTTLLSEIMIIKFLNA